MQNSSVMKIVNALRAPRSGADDLPFGHDILNMMPSLHRIAQALGGEVRAGQVIAPAPGHSPADRGMSIKLSDDAPDGFLVKLFNEGDPIAAKDYIRSKLGMRAVAAQWQGRQRVHIAGQGNGSCGCGATQRKARSFSIIGAGAATACARYPAACRCDISLR